ncbi:allatostatins-like [Limulus polyphemus]|uniref:Allatostatins-like n=1 Tax=Limulus polyphemus TaxID=6850 RepID=A0ABM1C664_LIMPO|nr:allatostatins-like [Limulus polyphemus]
MFSRITRGVLFAWGFLWMTQLITISLGEEREDTQDPSYTEKKRTQDLYRFGLGKRRQHFDDFESKKADQMYSFGLGKRDSFIYPYDFLSEHPGHQSSFSNNKRVPQQFAFGLGKRILLPHMYNLDDKRDFTYDFGLGKRNDERERFSFGLGKRQEKHFDFGLGKRSSLESDIPREYEDFIKRRFHFGLGKREDREYSFGLGRKKRETNAARDLIN